MTGPDADPGYIPGPRESRWRLTGPDLYAAMAAETAWWEDGTAPAPTMAQLLGMLVERRGAHDCEKHASMNDYPDGSWDCLCAICHSTLGFGRGKGDPTARPAATITAGPGSPVGEWDG